MKKYLVKENEQAIRIDKLISMLDSEISRVTIQRMIDNRKHPGKWKKS